MAETIELKVQYGDKTPPARPMRLKELVRSMRINGYIYCKTFRIASNIRVTGSKLGYTMAMQKEKNKDTKPGREGRYYVFRVK